MIQLIQTTPSLQQFATCCCWRFGKAWHSVDSVHFGAFFVTITFFSTPFLSLFVDLYQHDIVFRWLSICFSHIHLPCGFSTLDDNSSVILWHDHYTQYISTWSNHPHLLKGASPAPTHIFWVVSRDYISNYRTYFNETSASLETLWNWVKKPTLKKIGGVIL